MCFCCVLVILNEKGELDFVCNNFWNFTTTTNRNDTGIDNVLNSHEDLIIGFDPFINALKSHKTNQNVS